jgi:hypothetical protein
MGHILRPLRGTDLIAVEPGLSGLGGWPTSSLRYVHVEPGGILIK